jgi:hypothetical protein
VTCPSPILEKRLPLLVVILSWYGDVANVK